MCSSPRFIGSSTMSMTVTNPKYLWYRMGTEHSVAQRKVRWLYSLKFDVFAFINTLCLPLGLCELLECCGRRFHTLSGCVQSIQHFLSFFVLISLPGRHWHSRMILIQGNHDLHTFPWFSLFVWADFALFHVTPWNYVMAQDVLFLYSFLIFPWPLRFFLAVS